MKPYKASWYSDLIDVFSLGRQIMGENHCSNDVFRVNLSMVLSFVLDLDGLLPPNHYKGFFCVWIIFQKIRFI